MADEFNDMMNDPELTQETLQKKLNDYSAAIRQEFEESTKADPNNYEEYTRDFFKKNIHSMAAQVVWLANNSDSDSVRLSACKYGIDMALAQSKEDGDPIKALLSELTSGKAKAASTN